MARHSRGIICLLLSGAAALAADDKTPTKDTTYLALRSALPDQSFPVSGVTLKRDAAVIQLIRGKISFLPPTVEGGKRTIGVFSGEGKLVLAPTYPGEAGYLARLTGSAELSETFTEALLAFTDGTYEELTKGATPGEGEGAEILGRFRKRLRQNPENPHSFLEAMMTGDDADNLEAEILTDIYDPAGGGMFNLYLSGAKRKDLRFLFRPRGAMPGFSSVEESALVHLNPGESEEGVLYMAPRQGGQQGDIMERAAFDAERYTVDSVIDGKKLSGVTTIEIKARRDGARVLRLGLLPDLRVSEVTLNGEALDFVQEPKDTGGPLFVLLPRPATTGQAFSLRVTYKGDKVVSDEGGGNFAVRARTSWYPNLNSFQDRALFDLTFRTDPKLVLVSVGRRTEEAKDGKQLKSRWVSETPLAVAGFNLGRYKKQELTDTALNNYLIEGYASSQAPSYLQTPEGMPGESPGGSLTSNVAPSALIKQVMNEAQMSMRIFTNYYGPAPYGRLALTQQPEFNFGQSWPGLVYLPVSAFMDGTQRWALMGSAAFKFSEFVQEVTAHEVAHQWWGHVVGWGSYRDQWLSEGFADFSAGLYLQLTRKDSGEYHKYLDRWRESILDKNRFGTRANDLGPIDLGLRLNVPRVPGAHSRIVYAKGGYVLHMLRMMMSDAQAGDKPFMAMMREFVTDRQGRSATTADFQRVVEKHFPAVRNPDPNGKLDWFFDQWVHGQDVPSYKLQYSMTPQDGKLAVKARITQSGVPEGFQMPVVLYGDIGGRVVRLGLSVAKGSKTGDEIAFDLPPNTKELFLNYNRDVLADKVEVVRDQVKQ